LHFDDMDFSCRLGSSARPLGGVNAVERRSRVLWRLSCLPRQKRGDRFSRRKGLKEGWRQPRRPCGQREGKTTQIEPGTSRGTPFKKRGIVKGKMDEGRIIAAGGQWGGLDSARGPQGEWGLSRPIVKRLMGGCSSVSGARQEVTWFVPGKD